MSELEKLRNEADKVDEKIIELIAERTAYSYKISHWKARQNMLVTDKKREELIFKHVRELAVANNIEEKLAEDIYKILITYCRDIQKLKQ